MATLNCLPPTGYALIQPSINLPGPLIHTH
jgi:hypothetical protein